MSNSQRKNGVRQQQEMTAEPLPHSEDFQLLTATEAAELIRLPRSSLYELTRTRRVPFVRIGRRVFFVRSELVRWLVNEMSVPARRR